MLTIVAPDHVENTRTAFENITRDGAKLEFENATRHHNWCACRFCMLRALVATGAGGILCFPRYFSSKRNGQTEKRIYGDGKS